MHLRRVTPPLAMAALLVTTGCVAVPDVPAPAVPTPAAGPVPAAVRPPAPRPAWPVPAQPAPRETLAATEPFGPEEPAREARAGKTPGQARERTRRGTDEAARTPRRRSPAVTPMPKGPDRVRPGKQPAGQAPSLRSLCRQADRSQAVPPEIVDLCRATYGR
ncbi:hypothetical protein ACIGBL_24530 [Streptomyces sp. NPDC085614]|uniref:hypothetical protein n=1 Tax=Streptomyces sp. NPDC085614 TaxID=3365733 RepID=UPI0037CD8964